MNELEPKESGGEFLLYQTEDGQVRLDVRLQDETVWLTQPLMAELFQTTQQNISQHIRNVFEEGELTPEATHKKFLSVRREGKRDVRRALDFYNLDMIISVGYRVKSLIATHFRIWATQQLKEYIIKGFVMDDERLKNPPVKDSAAPDYFDEVLARVCEVVSLEKDGDTVQALETIKSEFPAVEDFERDFPSLCFAIATGVGKTRLMGAFISYLYLSEGIRHFFVLAPIFYGNSCRTKLIY